MEVIDKLHNTLVAKHIEVDPKQRTKVVVKSFYDEYTNFLDVAESKAQISHDDNLFSIVCQNIKNDLLSLDTCIKEL